MKNSCSGKMQEISASAVSPELDGRQVRLKGWVEEIRELGGITFLILRDATGTAQITVPRKQVNGEINKVLSILNRESVIEIRGSVKRSEKARRGVEVIPDSMQVYSLAEKPLPMGVVDRVNVEADTRFDNRFMDLRKAERAVIFRVRSHMTLLLRKELERLGFVEVHTPKIVAEGAEGGATLFKVDYFGKKAYLAQSPQLYKQILMSSSLNRVYEIAPAYRAEPSDTVRHTSEFISFDAEMSFIDGLEDVLSTLEELMHSVLVQTAEQWRERIEDAGYAFPQPPRRPFRRLRYTECLDILNSEGNAVREGDDLDTEAEKIIGRAMAEKGYSMYFITHYPEAIKPFYIMEEGTYSLSFDLEFIGTEMASGGQREHRYQELVERMKKKQLDPKSFSFYLNAFRYGMPPHGGWGLGMDRLVSTFLNLGNIREAILFPRDRIRLAP